MQIQLFYKFIISVAASLFFSFAAHSQQPPKTKEELEVMIKSIKKKADSMQNAMKNRGTAGKPNPTGGTPIKPVKSQSANDPENITLPPRDSVRIGSIPKKRFTVPELRAYLTDLYDQLSRKFPADAVSSAKSIASKLSNNPAKIESAALMAWENGADEEAVLLITKAAAVSGDDGLPLVNAGAILDMYGLSEKAIPVLRTVVTYDQQNAIALNNLGQAFTAVGMQDSAMNYFSKCLSLSPQHPEANNTAGLIELKKGNKARAQTYFENSLRGGFNLSAYAGLRSILKEKCRIAHLIKPKVKFPEYFNQFKYKLPRQCLNVNEAATVKEEFDNYKKMLSTEMRKYDLLKKESEKAMGKNRAAEFNQKTMEKVTKGQSYLKPFQMLGSIMESEAIVGYSGDIGDLVKFNNENREQYKQLEKEYSDAHEQFMNSGGSCAQENELKNKYLPRFAQLNEEWQSRNMLFENKYIDDLLYWCYFSAFDKKDYTHRFYSYVYNYMYKLNILAQVKILDPCEEREPDEVEKPVPKELPEFDCPATIKLSFVVGKLSMDCEKFSFKAGELIVFKFEKQFTGKRQSTISIGGGGGVDLSQQVGPIKAGFEAGMDMSLFLTFDKAGNCTDAGMSYKAYRGAGVDFTAGERININKNLGYQGEEIGWRFGINSGVSFTTPDIPYMKEPQEVQKNKNVKIYQANQ
jgi:Flp pilus assembly protein TadD